MKTFVRCGQLFTGNEDDARSSQMLVFDEEGVIAYIGPEEEMPRRLRGDRTLDYSSAFVMPGLIDLHYHTALGKGYNDHLPLWEYLDECWYRGREPGRARRQHRAAGPG